MQSDELERHQINYKFAITVQIQPYMYMYIHIRAYRICKLELIFKTHLRINFDDEPCLAYRRDNSKQSFPNETFDAERAFTYD